MFAGERGFTAKRRLKFAMNSGSGGVADLHRADAPKPHLLDEAARQRPASLLHAPLRLRAAGVDRLDVQRLERPPELRQLPLAPRWFTR